MLTCYCPHSSCASKVTYDTIKPTVCPKCRRAFADAFKVAPAPAPVVASTPSTYEPEDDRPIGRAALARRGSTTQVKLRPVRAATSHIMNAPPELQVDAAVDDDDFEGDGEDVVSPREVRRRARELAASIDPSTIVIADQDEGVFRFKDMWDEGAAAREKAAKVRSTTKRKGRR